MSTPNVLLGVARRVGHLLHKALKMLSIINTILNVLGAPHMPSDLQDKANTAKSALQDLISAIQAFIDPPDTNLLLHGSPPEAKPTATTVISGHKHPAIQHKPASPAK